MVVPESLDFTVQKTGNDQITQRDFSMKNAVRSFACACACLFTLASFAALPSGYTRLEYIQGNGTDGRILTDFTPKPTTDKIVAEVAFVSTANNGTIWCARGNGSQVATWTLFRIGDTFRFDYNTAVAVTTSALLLNNEYTVTAENKTFSWSGGAGGSSTLGDLTQAGGPIMLFASYHSGTGSNLGNFSNHKLYSFKIYRNNQLIHDFIPCTDADGNATLYDDVASGQATLTRTGIFTAGPAYDVYALRVEAPATQYYDGDNPCTPHPNVYNRITGELLTENTHYTLSWSNNSAPGTATVTATGKAGSDYEGREASANFAISPIRYVKPDGDATKDGTGGWANATTLAHALAVAAANDCLRLQAGTYPISAVHVTDKALTIAGGYEGTTGVSDALAANPVSTLDGEDKSVNVLQLTAASGASTLERLAVIRAARSGFVKSGASTLFCTNCVFAENGKADASISGLGLNLAGGAVTLASCVIRDNISYVSGYNKIYGFGLYAGSVSSLTLSSCEFIRNGLPWNATSGAYLDKAREHSAGAAIYATATPVVARGCAFTSNHGNIHGGNGQTVSGGIVYLLGSATGHSFVNCLWRGNTCYATANNKACTVTGMLTINANAASRTLNVDSCTFAYNTVYASMSPAALNIVKGTATVRNTIFFGNILPPSTGYGSDLHVASGSSADVDTSAFSALGSDNITSAGTLTLGSGNFVCPDPKFATPLSTFAANVVGGVTGSTRGSATPYLPGTFDGTTLDCHLRSRSGRWTGTEWTNDDETSSAIGRGAYAGTSEASKLPTGAPSISTPVPSSTDDGRVTLSFTLDGEADYVANVIVQFGTEEGVWSRTINLGWHGWQEEFLVPSQQYFAKGTTVRWRVTAATTGKPTAEQSGSFATTIAPGAWFGHGGDAATIVHVRQDALGAGDGTSWADACPTFDAAFDVFNANSGRTEIWLLDNLTNAAKIVTKNINRALTIRGGFKPTDDALADRTPGRLGVLSGNKVQNGISINNSAAVTVERLEFTDTKYHSFTKTDGAGDLTFRDCRFTSGGWHMSAETVNGYGLNATGTSAAYLTLTNCVFADNGGRSGSYGHKLYGAAAYMKTFKRVTIDDCHFLTNGICVNMVIPSSYPVAQEAGWGWAFALNGAPVTMRNSTVIGNRGTQHNGNTRGLVYLEGNCGGSAFTNCVFAANSIRYNANSCADSGTLDIALDTAARTVEVVNCTFAYNLINSGASAAGITVTKGALKLRNSVFYGNVVKNTCSCGADIHLTANGTADVDYCFFKDTTSDCLSSATPANLTLGDNNRTGDPLLVTDFESMKPNAIVDAKTAATFATDSTTRYTSSRCFYGPATDFTTVDVHLKSGAGRWTGTAWTEDAASSPAIDGGDPEGAYAKEPSPNGERLNMGAYGNTVEASKTPNGKPSISAVTIVQDRDYTQPFFQFSLAGDVDYTATVTLYYGTEDGGEGEWQHSRVLSAGATRGTAFDSGTQLYFNKDEKIYWKIVAEATGGTGRATGDFTITGNPPPWKDVPAQANVVYVRPGAMCAADGSSWSDALTTLRDGLLAFKADATKTEIWLADTNLLSAAAAAVTLSRACTIRGGFRGWEETAAERPAALRSVCDGAFVDNALTIENSAALEIERVEFTRGLVSGLVKTGAGNLVLRDCRFYDNHNQASGIIYGLGLNAQPNDANTLITVKDCVFDHNVIRNVDYNMRAYGCAIYVNKAARVMIDNTLFATNGALPSLAAESSTACQEGFEGSALNVNSAPVTLTNCRFVGNRGTQHQGGGSTVYISDTSSACALTNCLFLANETRTVNWYNKGHVNTGALTFNLSANATPCEVVNCTFAYGLYTTAQGSGAVNLIKGTLKVLNSIFYGNLVTCRYPFSGTTQTATAAADLYVSANGTADVGWSLFATEDATFSRRKASGGTIVEHDCVYGDPLLETSFATMTNSLAKSKQSSADFAISNTYHITGIPIYKVKTDYTAMSAHLRSKRGYLSEFDGQLHRDRAVRYNPAVDAGDPASDYSKEPAGANGKRINLGFYGNTPYATRSASTGFSVIVR